MLDQPYALALLKLEPLLYLSLYQFCSTETYNLLRLQSLIAHRNFEEKIFDPLQRKAAPLHEHALFPDLMKFPQLQGCLMSLFHAHPQMKEQLGLWLLQFKDIWYKPYPFYLVKRGQGVIMEPKIFFDPYYINIVLDERLAKQFLPDFDRQGILNSYAVPLFVIRLLHVDKKLFMLSETIDIIQTCFITMTD